MACQTLFYTNKNDEDKETAEKIQRIHNLERVEELLAYSVTGVQNGDKCNPAEPRGGDPKQQNQVPDIGGHVNNSTNPGRCHQVILCISVYALGIVGMKGMSALQ